MVQPTPFQRLLGDDFGRLPLAVRHLHGLTRAQETAGLADITAPRGVLPWLIAWIAGLPRPGREVPVTVGFYPDGQGAEYWKRQFGTRRYASTMKAGPDGALMEHFGPFQLYFRLTPVEEGLHWLLTRWRFLKVPLPRWTVPRVECFETGDAGRFVFDIDVVFPIAGPVIHYSGWLVPVAGKELA